MVNDLVASGGTRESGFHAQLTTEAAVRSGVESARDCTRFVWIAIKLEARHDQESQRRLPGAFREGKELGRAVQDP